jgi:hypothetical protein
MAFTWWDAELAMADSLVESNGVLIRINNLVSQTSNYRRWLANVGVPLFQIGSCRNHHGIFLGGSTQCEWSHNQIDGKLLTEPFAHRFWLKYPTDR